MRQAVMWLILSGVLASVGCAGATECAESACRENDSRSLEGDTVETTVTEEEMAVVAERMRKEQPAPGPVLPAFYVSSGFDPQRPGPPGPTAADLRRN